MSAVAKPGAVPADGICVRRPDAPGTAAGAIASGVMLGASAAAGIYSVGAWAAAGALLRPPPLHRQVPAPLLVVRVDGDSVVLSGAGAEAPGLWGLATPDGAYAQLGSDVVLVEGGWRRHATIVRGQLSAGQRARFDAHRWPDDPAAPGRPWAPVRVHGELGDLPAWCYPAGDGRTWAIVVHGRSTARAQAFRLLDHLAAAGATSLVVSYRTDPDAPTVRHGGLGGCEWRDVEAAVEYARDAGAERILLVGFSLGGAIVLSLLRRSQFAGLVVGAILDAPVASWRQVLHHVARRARLPGALVPLTLAAAGVRGRLDRTVLDHLAGADDLEVPLLVLHGTADPTVPILTSEELAVRRPDLVTLVRFPGAGHCTAWNSDPERYGDAVEGFVAALGARRSRRPADPPVPKMRQRRTSSSCTATSATVTTVKTSVSNEP